MNEELQNELADFMVQFIEYENDYGLTTNLSDQIKAAIESFFSQQETDE